MMKRHWLKQEWTGYSVLVGVGSMKPVWMIEVIADDNDEVRHVHLVQFYCCKAYFLNVMFVAT